MRFYYKVLFSSICPEACWFVFVCHQILQEEFRPLLVIGLTRNLTNLRKSDGYTIYW